MNYQQEREAFIAKVAAEGLPITVIRTILAKANALQRISELQCSSALADRDRVKCPADPSRKFGKGACICDATPFRSRECRDCGVTFDADVMLSINTSNISGELSVYCADKACNSRNINSGPIQIRHEAVPRIDVQEANIKRQLDKLMAGRNGFRLNYQGDPRGAVVKLAVPSGAYDDVSKEGLCVPAKGLPGSYWEREDRIMAGIYAMESRRA